MSYVSELELVQNDYGYDLEFQLKDDEGDAVDLTGNTSIKVFIAELEATTTKVTGTCIPTDEEGGLCKYTVESGDFDEAPKTYEVEVEVTYASKVVTARGLIIEIKTELPESEPE